MVQPEIEGVGHGKPVMPFGSDGAKWIAFLIDTLGHLQVDVVSAALGSDAATETTLLLIKGYVDTLETLLSGGLPAALDTGAFKVKEQSPLTGFATSANQATMITALQLIDDLRAALGSVNTDDLQVDVKTSALPTDAATQTTLALVKTAVEKIDDLQGALGSVATDKLLVASKSGDKIFGFESVVNDADTFILAGGTTIGTSGAVPTGKVWVITAISVTNNARAATSYYGGILTDSTYVYLLADPDGTTQWNQSPFICQIYLKAGDKIFFYIGGGQNGDNIRIDYSGYQMNAP